MNKMQAFKIAAAVRDVLEMGVGCAAAARPPRRRGPRQLRPAAHAHRRRAARRGTPPAALTVQSGLLKGFVVIFGQQQIKLMADATKLRQQVFGFNVAPAARGEVRPAAFEKVTVRGDDCVPCSVLIFLPGVTLGRAIGTDVSPPLSLRGSSDSQSFE